MLLAEDPLALLLDRLRTLSPEDRDGVLARLAPSERARVEEALGEAAETGIPMLAPDIVARIAAPADDQSMTPAARNTLLRVAGRSSTIPVIQLDRSPTPSLFERLGSAMRRR